MRSPQAVLARARARRPLLDHLVRAVARYQADTGDRLAASVTFYWFLSLFPLLLLGVSVLGVVYDDPGKDLSAELAKVLPSTLAVTLEDVITSNTGTTGVLGVGGLLLSGLGWIDALREAIRTMWHQNVLAGNIVVRKAVDVLVLVGLLATLGASVVFTGLVTAFTGTVLEWLGVDDPEAVGPAVLTRIVGYSVALLVDTGVFLYLLTRLARVRTPVSRVLRGAVFGAIGFEVLKVVGGLYVERTTAKGEATYGTFAVVIGLLLFLNLVSRLILLTAAFVVTAPYDSDVAPSGTASREQARKAGIPEAYADSDPDDPPALQEDGAPTPLRPVLQGRTPPQDEPEGEGRSWSRRAEPTAGDAPAARLTDPPAATPIAGSAG
ncbi:MAG: YihY/virulence factor BrkB family protein, partial [Mycobacteriales bacterium]|nr:YihY/virulence factor BrkB family protein [Mycobacteriales bacterium]